MSTQMNGPEAQVPPPAAALATTSAAPPSMEMLKYKEELAGKMGLPSPYGMTLMKEMATDLVTSGFVPKHFANNPMGVYLAAMRGREMNLGPMESILETFWSAPGGRLAMYAGKMLDILHRNGVTSEFLREDKEACEILFTPPAPHKPYNSKFTRQEAKDAGLIKSDSNWEKWGADMNKARCIARGWRALAGTFKGGSANLYCPEELDGIEQEADDERRMAKLTEQAESFKAEVKPGKGKAAAAPAAPAEPAPVIDVKPEPKAEPKPESKVEGKPEPKPESKVEGKPEPKAAEAELVAPFAIYRAVDDKLMPTAMTPQVDLDAAKLMARAQANATHETYVVLDTRSNREAAICNPAEHSSHINRVPAKDEAPAVTPEVSSELKEELKARLSKLAVELRTEDGKPIPAKTAAQRFNSFIAGYLDCTVKELPKDAAKFVLPVEELEVVIARDPEEFRAGPEQAGRRCRERAESLAKYAESMWKGREDIQSLACRLAKGWGLPAEAFKTFIERNELDFLDLNDLYAYLRVAMRTRDAAQLLTLAKNHKLSIAAIVGQIEKRGLQCSVEAAKVDTLENAIRGYSLAVKEQAKPAPAATPAAARKAVDPEPYAQPAAPPEDEGDDDGLFGDL